jgi:hypothetical protein
MSKKIFGLVSLFVLAGMVLAPITVIHAYTAQEILDMLQQGLITFQEAQNLLNQITGQGGGTTTGGVDIDTGGPPALKGEDVLKVITTITNYAFGILLLIAVLMIIIAAYLFVTAGGNPETIGKARNWLIYALVGIAIAVLARGLVELVKLIIGQPGG